MTMFFRTCLRGGHPFAVEVVGDPRDVLAPGSIRHAFRPLLRRWATHQLRNQCRAACAAAYVTASTLQRHYPPNADAFTTHYSSVELQENAFASEARRYSPGPRTFRIICIGSLEQPYKGVDVLVDAVAMCSTQGLRIELRVIGDGRFRSGLERRAADRGLGGAARFLGTLPAGAPVRAALDDCDVFVLASRTEGLPRAMIEAMARALPCVGTDVGGIPELLPPDCLVPKDDAAALAGKLREVLADPERMTGMSANNLARAREYEDRRIGARRRAYLQYVREATERWMRRQRDVSRCPPTE